MDGQSAARCLHWPAGVPFFGCHLPWRWSFIPRAPVKNETKWRSILLESCGSALTFAAASETFSLLAARI